MFLFSIQITVNLLLTATETSPKLHQLTLIIKKIIKLGICFRINNFGAHGSDGLFPLIVSKLCGVL